MTNNGRIFGCYKRIHFVGIGGISMSSLAAIAKSCGHTVSGSDDDGGNIMLSHLRELGINIHIGLCAENIDAEKPDAVVYTAAIREDNPELVRARELNIPEFTRAEYLGEVMKNYRQRIGVSGTHGKSTTTAMVYSVYDAAGLVPTLCLGATLPSSGSAYTIGNRDAFIYEACEYTDSFLHFYPSTALILNIELDHVDYFKSLDSLVRSFGKSLENADIAITLKDSETCLKALADFEGRKIFISADDKSADYYAGNVARIRGMYSFDVMRRGEKLARVSLSVPGFHNLTNALFAFAAAYENGVPAEACRKGLESFRGIDRRFQKVGEYKGRDVYIDYAHHPGEIGTTVRTAREMEVGRLFVVFQSHTHTRTAKFVNEFAKELSQCDEVIITSTYAAREAVNDTGVTAEGLASMIPSGRFIPDFRGVVDYIKKNGKENDTYIFMGAGTVNNAAFMLISEDDYEKEEQDGIQRI